MQQPFKPELFATTEEERRALFSRNRNPARRVKTVLVAIGVLLTPIVLIGACIGYARSYKRVLKKKNLRPLLHPLYPVSRYAMAVFAGITVIYLVAIVFAIWLAIVIFQSQAQSINGHPGLIVYLYLNLVLSVLALAAFEIWRNRILSLEIEAEKFGTAQFASDEELRRYEGKTGLYLGGGYTLPGMGHILTVAGTRGGKGTSLIIPNLLGISNYAGSMVVIDTKGENAAITARYQREAGRKVVILNPWDMHADIKDRIGEASSFNPLDLLSDKSSMHLVDDAQILAEMIVPIDDNDHEKFFTDTARNIICGLIVHLMTDKNVEDRSLATIWNWVRYTQKDWNALLSDMATSRDPVNGNIVKNTARELEKLEKAGDETFGSVMASVFQATDFLKSLALQKSMQSGFSPYDLANGEITLYVIIPADKLKSHSRWLRLVVTSCLRAVIRKPNKRVTFLLDEFAALGYLSEIEIALGTYAGFNITIWPILQSLIQLQGLYEKSWESFVANCTARQFFSINDNFTADYVSTSIGMTSNVIGSKGLLGLKNLETNQRLLMTPDEVRRGSGDNIFSFMGELPPTYFRKRPYYMIQELDGRADNNPYLKLQLS